MKTADQIRDSVRRHYAAVARTGRCCPPPSAEASACCEPTAIEDVGAAPSLAGLGCGFPVASASLRPGEIVLDLGSGLGGDALRAAREVGAEGRVIGVDMTAEMAARAEADAARLGFANVEFRQGVIEALPVADASVDVVLSNCVINLAPDKRAVFREAYRVLKVGGRLIVSDMVAARELPAATRDDAEAWAACIGGAIPEADYLDAIRAAGFSAVRVIARQREGAEAVYSITVRADKSAPAA